MEGYQIIDKKNRRKLAEFLANEEDVLLPLLGMVETAEASVNAAIDTIGSRGDRSLADVIGSAVGRSASSGQETQRRHSMAWSPGGFGSIG